MKYIKTYEKKIELRGLRKGDYVFCQSMYDKGQFLDELKQFIDSNIGQYVEYDRSADFKYGVFYENAPKKLNMIFFNNENTIWFTREEILEYSPNKENLEIKIHTKKYNL